MLEPRTSVRRVEVITETGRRRSSRPTTRHGSSRRRWPLVPWCRGRAAARIVAATAVYVAPANATAGCDPCGSRAADVRARCRYPIVHAAGALTAAAPTPPEGVRGRREQRHHRARDQRRRGPGRPRRGCRDGCGRDPCAEDLHVIGPTGAVRVMVAARPASRSDAGGRITTRHDHTRSSDGRRRPSSPSPATRAGTWRCAMPRAPRPESGRGEVSFATIADCLPDNVERLLSLRSWVRIS